jgi:ABC-2 type transport system ATP-binding protein
VSLSKTYKGSGRGCLKFLSSSEGGDVEALRNIYLEVAEGELLGIMGHNGAGKTTLINTLCGYV